MQMPLHSCDIINIYIQVVMSFRGWTIFQMFWTSNIFMLFLVWKHTLSRNWRQLPGALRCTPAECVMLCKLNMNLLKKGVNHSGFLQANCTASQGFLLKAFIQTSMWELKTTFAVPYKDLSGEKCLRLLSFVRTHCTLTCMLNMSFYH